MADFKITTILKENFKSVDVKSNNKIVVLGTYFNEDYVFVFSSPAKKILCFGSDLSAFQFTKDIFGMECQIVKIVGNKTSFILCGSDGTLYNYDFNEDSFLSRLQKFPLLVVFAIVEFRGGFACAGTNGDKSKSLIFFEPDTLPNFEDFTFSDLNANDSNDYYLTVVKRQYLNESLIISDNFSGKTYLCSENGHFSVIYVSEIPLISALPIMSEDCLLLCFKNGKLFFHFFSQVCSNRSLFLNNRVTCIEKCFCNDSCFLWSNGANIHHMEISFHNGDFTMRNFEVQNNIVGVTSLFRVGQYIIAATINNAIYELSVGKNGRKEIFQAPGEILSQIHQEGLKINDFQKKLESASEYLNFKERMQNNQACLTLNCKGDNLFLKNISEMTFKKEIWKIELRAVCDEEFVWVKLLKLETDVASGMVIKVKNPFDKSKRFNVYLTGIFEEEILCILVGTVWEEATKKKKEFEEVFKSDFRLISISKKDELLPLN